MKILKYNKKNGNKYELILEDNRKIILYEDVILKEELLLKKEIDDLSKLEEINQSYEIYDVSLRYLNHHVISIKGLRDYLERKKYSSNDIDITINKLINKGYLNDYYYAKCYINDHLNLSLDGPLKIKKHLDDNDIDYKIYFKDLNHDDDFWMNRIKRYLDKQIKVNKKSIYLFKSKMLLNLINLGYEKELINSCLNNIKFDNQDELKEKEKAKLRTKLEKKYNGEELERKIKEKLYQKGFFE